MKGEPNYGYIERQMLDLLVCPLTHGPLVLDASGQELVSSRARLAYPVRDGIPIMLVSEARKLSDEEYPAADKS